ncbi:MAG TPA: trypsin-like peptidase domain-containing protein [Tahibacter sp.]|uniref:trypsin-like serine peptidase n=1 Tax=Tahibacter sp. TaxID=2056211 RepID=UPI002C4D3EA2|nr:trypsin-like peptidase domain-containing protein [Tahibacter sp.]HSX61275.1 trypsin-like peptidase domain-containing protein [Tahibacter sp.]
MKARSLSLALSLLLAGGAQAAVVTETSSEVLRVDPAAAPKTQQWRSGAKAAAVAPLLQLPPLAAERVAAVKRRNEANGQRRVQIGVSRDIASEAVDDLPKATLHYVDGGAVLRLDVAAQGAAALRSGLRANWPDGVELRVAGSDGTIYAVDAAAARRQSGADGVFWTAVTDGERQQLELFVPAGIDPAGVALRVETVSHLIVSPLSATHSKALGDSGSCNIDVVCRTGSGSLGAPLVNIKNAVARMVYQSGGGSYTCTGTLLNDIDSSTQIPWFFTAHHCIGNQTEASSLTTFWNYETPSCGVDNSGPNTQSPGGGQLVYSEGSTDGALLRLNSTPPNGAVLAGWNAAALTPSTSVVGVHHPSGDIKKVSQGNHSGTRENVTFDGQTVASTWKSSWSEGTTEGGSSGSGLFTLAGAGYQLRGGLFGGGASCSNTGQSETAGNVDFYSRLDRIFPSISQYIASTGGAVGPTRDYTGQWDVRAEGGRGVSMFQFGNVLFALWFVYDNQGRAAWYQLDPQWTGADVAGGRVVKFTGSPWGPTYNPDARQLIEVGTFTLTFTSGTAANFSYNVDGVNRSVLLQKY